MVSNDNVLQLVFFSYNFRNIELFVRNAYTKHIFGIKENVRDEYSFSNAIFYYNIFYRFIDYLKYVDIINSTRRKYGFSDIDSGISGDDVECIMSRLRCLLGFNIDTNYRIEELYKYLGIDEKDGIDYMIIYHNRPLKKLFIIS